MVQKLIGVFTFSSKERNSFTIERGKSISSGQQISSVFAKKTSNEVSHTVDKCCVNFRIFMLLHLNSINCNASYKITELLAFLAEFYKALDDCNLFCFSIFFVINLENLSQPIFLLRKMLFRKKKTLRMTSSRRLLQRHPFMETQTGKLLKCFKRSQTRDVSPGKEIPVAWEAMKGVHHNQSLLPFQKVVKIVVLGLLGMIGLEG